MLGLLRHAKSDWDDMGKRDYDRGLNERGRRGAVVIGQHIEDHGIAWDTIIASPAARVKQTMANALPNDHPIFDERLYLATSDSLMEAVRDHGGDANTLLLAGHNPGMQELLFALVSPSNENALFDEAATKFPTASFAVLELAIDDWAQIKDGCGTLIHFARPRDLDPALGPER